MNEKQTKEVLMILTMAITAVAVTLVFLGIDWLLLLPWSIQSPGFLFFLSAYIVTLALSELFAYTAYEEKNKKQEIVGQAELKPVWRNILIGVGVLIVGVWGIGIFSSVTMFNSEKYANLLNFSTQEFSEVISEQDNISDIAIMDTDSAIIMGKRTMGTLTDLVSQYVVSDLYSQICYKGKPMKVATLEYGGLIKYFNNKSRGVPGYVMVDPVANSASYVSLDTPIRYTPSAVLKYDLLRHVRKSYKTAILYDMYFEIDDNGQPFWICPVMKSSIGLFGGKKVTDVLVVDACTGDITKYAIENTPQWIDRTYDGDLLSQYYNYYGLYQGGFINSIFGNKGCTATTDDYGYKVINDDVWIYTGITSLSSDESNIGFILMNQRTAESIYMPVAGAEEYSAMSAGEGLVQDLGYIASFPSLINIDGLPTYLMCLKDSGGLVKSYALVNVEQYQINAIGKTQSEALKNYRRILAEGKDIIEGDSEAVITIDQIIFVQQEDATFVYIKGIDGMCFRANFADNEAIILLNEGDEIRVSYIEQESLIHLMTSFEVK